jgi:hypothetical protein
LHYVSPQTIRNPTVAIMDGPIAPHGSSVLISLTKCPSSDSTQALIREAFRLEWLPIGWTTANPLLAAIAALALAGAALAQETDSDVATGEQGFSRFASLCRDQKAACDAAFRFGALVGADAATRCALADDRIACFKKDEQSGVYGR